MSQFALTAKVAKLNEAENLVFGWASVVADADGEHFVDAHGDVIHFADLEKAAYDFTENARQAGVMHEQMGVGRIVESFAVTPEKKAAGVAHPDSPLGWWIGFRVTPEVFEQARAGKLTEFSIGGEAVSEAIDG